jgi:adenylylsulfate kinase-like enzyme
MIYVVYGQPGSGKTTLGKLLAGNQPNYLVAPTIIDGDEFRGMFANKNYSKQGREENIRNANAVATYLSKKGNDVIISLVNPYLHLRNELKENNAGRVIEILLESSRELRREYHVKDFESGNPDHLLNTDGEVNHTWNKLRKMLK